MILPKEVKIVEVGPRDGFQNVKSFIETEDKIEIIKKLIDSGLKHIEITSFVHPKWVPQMKDADIVVKEIRNYINNKDVELIALVPNKYGALKAKEAKVDTITYVISASETHNKNNVNRSIEESFIELESIIKEMDDVKIRLAIATSFGCPFEKKVSVNKVLDMAERGLDIGVSKILLADTIGVANPLQVKKMIQKIKEKIELDHIGIHFHDTKGMGLANTLVALEEGIKYFESAVGGLGGCPYAPGAAGNIATEDLLNMLNLMGIKTNIDLNIIMEAVNLVKDKVNANVVSHMASAICH